MEIITLEEQEAGLCHIREDKTHCIHWWDDHKPCCNCLFKNPEQEHIGECKKCGAYFYESYHKKTREVSVREDIYNQTCPEGNCFLIYYFHEEAFTAFNIAYEYRRS